MYKTIHWGLLKLKYFSTYNIPGIFQIFLDLSIYFNPPNNPLKQLLLLLPYKKLKQFVEFIKQDTLIQVLQLLPIIARISWFIFNFKSLLFVGKAWTFSGRSGLSINKPSYIYFMTSVLQFVFLLHLWVIKQPTNQQTTKLPTPQHPFGDFG